MPTTDPKVMVIGAGPVGLTLACELYRHGVPCRIIEQASEPHQHSKAFAVHARTLEVFTQMGVAPEMLAQGQPVAEANFFSGRKRMLRTSFKELDVPYPYFLALPQYLVERTLEKQLNQLGGKVERGVALTHIAQNGHLPTLTLTHSQQEEETVNPTWVVGCDGGRSAVRKQLAIPFTGRASDMGFIVVDAKVKWPAAAPGANTYLTDKGYLMLVPFPKEGYYRLVLDCPAGEQKQAPTLEEVNRLKEAYGFGDLEISEPLWISRTQVQRRMVPDFRHGSVFLAGDAAHLHSPVGGQGLNTGIQDAHNLGWKLAYVCRGLSTTALLDTYNEERHPVVAAVLQRTDLLNRMLTVKQPVLKFLRNALYALLSSKRSFRLKTAGIAAGLDYHYRKSSGVLEDAAGSSRKVTKRAGDLVPGRVWIKGDTPGKPLTDWWQDTRFILMLLGGTGDQQQSGQQLKDLAVTVNRQYPQQVTCCLVCQEEVAADPEQPGLLGLTDRENHYHQLFGEDKPALYLIRPDGYIAYHSHQMNVRKLLAYLNGHLIKQHELSAAALAS
jgi:2-polyprenyl-6-methoxyphenol hydroxylase-like FAD-dependent oxidoreductase